MNSAADFDQPWDVWWWLEPEPMLLLVPVAAIWLIRMGMLHFKQPQWRKPYVRLLVYVVPILLFGWLFLVQHARLAKLSDQLRTEAQKQFLRADYNAALADVRLAMRMARWLPATSVQVVEAYDDAGLYFYSSEQYEQSARYQAIAVLLAIGNPDLKQMLPVYLERLGWAWAKYRPGSDFSAIKANPLILLDMHELSLASDIRIREHFYRSTW